MKLVTALRVHPAAPPAGVSLTARKIKQDRQIASLSPTLVRRLFVCGCRLPAAAMALSSRQWQRWWRLAPSSSEDGLLPAVARMVAYKLVASWYGFEWVDVDIVKIAGSDTKELYFCQEVVAT